jgi:hypothetical protein
VRVLWRDGTLQCCWGEQKLSLQAPDWGGVSPATLSLYVVKGNVCFADFALHGR